GLGKEVAIEIRVTADAGVGQINVGDLAVSQLVHLPAIVLNPGEVAQTDLGIHWRYRDVPPAVAIRMGADLNRNRLAGGRLEGLIQVVGILDVLAVDGEQVFASFHVHAGLGQRSASLRVPVFAGINAGKAVPAILLFVIRAEQAAADL